MAHSQRLFPPRPTSTFCLSKRSCSWMIARPCSKISKAWAVIHLSATGFPSIIGSAGSSGSSGRAWRVAQACHRAFPCSGPHSQPAACGVSGQARVPSKGGMNWLQNQIAPLARGLIPSWGRRSSATTDPSAWKESLNVPHATGPLEISLR